MKDFARSARGTTPFAFVLAVTTACIFGLVGCSSSQPEEEIQDDLIAVQDASSEAAATVNGDIIPESEVTAAIEQMRSQMGASDESVWASYLIEQDQTPERLRGNIIDSLVEQLLVDQYANEQGITVEDSEIDAALQQIKDAYESEDQWQKVLASLGENEDDYRASLEFQLKAQKVQDNLNVDSSENQETLLEYAQLYATAGDGAKKSSHILFNEESRDEAQSVLDQINAGELSFADAAMRYSSDNNTAADGGNVGWDNLNAFSQEYTDALAQLEPGQISGLISTPTGVEIIECTEVYHAPEQVTSLDQIPSEWQDDIREIVGWQSQSQAYQTWLQAAKADADIQIADMPSGLPYDVDLSSYYSEEPADAVPTSQQ